MIAFYEAYYGNGIIRNRKKVQINRVGEQNKDNEAPVSRESGFSRPRPLNYPLEHNKGTAAAPRVSQYCNR
ncbi:hypothetical protein E2C01_035721 [Portunus trituberculatus]|uniref:Uncharacterized protein n=1 Tax=Portunus trituberculatus TaxID=210409 RepID=A0A5B7F972_PORTR|nr:hypothetical protein [Portunus trituberculatus]